MIKLKTGLYYDDLSTPECVLDRLGNEKDISLLRALGTFEDRCNGSSGKAPYRVAAFGWDGVELGPDLEEIYQAFRVRLLYELKDRIPGLVEIVEGDGDDDSED